MLKSPVLRITLAYLGLEKTETEWTFHTTFPENRTLNDVTCDLKRALVQEALHRAGQRTVQAAKLLGISRNSLNHYIASLYIDRHSD